MRTRACVGVLSLVLLAGSASAQPRIEATVVAVSGRSVFISIGRDKGVRPGSTLVYVLPDGQRVQATIQDVSAGNARAELLPTDQAPEVNTRAEVIGASGQAEPETTGPTRATQTPDHPPWTRKPDGHTEDMPLLAPAFATPPEQKPTAVHGRVYADVQQTHDNTGGSDYTLARAGLWMQVDNPFKDAGRILIAGAYDFRGTSISDGSHNDTNFRLERFSYARGLNSSDPYRIEVGRFYSSSLPELGLFDGVEGKVRFENGWSMGAGVGAYPTPYPGRESFTDYGFHLFADYEADRLGSLSSTIGYQQTWHDGRADRNLLIGRINARPSEKWWLFGSAMVDVYTGSDTLKDTIADVSQLLAQATYMPSPRTGFTATYIHTTWPELLREEYRNLPDNLIRTGRVDRISANAWRRVGEHVRLSARAHYWIDQDSDGAGGELGAEWYDALRKGSTLYGSVFYEDATYNDGLGARVQTRQEIGPVQLMASYEAFVYSVNRVAAGSETFLRHTLRADVAWSTRRWYYDASVGYTFGDNEDSISVGLFAEYRF